jgi:predicted dehydrogenase
MAKKRIRVALIGCGGNMRGAHVPRLQEDGAVDLVAVADTAEEQARLLMEKWGTEVGFYSDYRKMIRSETLDAVVVSSPHSTHYAQVRYALERGLHVLVEKPLTIGSARARALVELAKKNKRLLVVSYQRNFYPPHVYARELVKTGVLGKLTGVICYVTQNWGGVGGWRMVPELSGGGMFMDTGSHLVSSVLWITGLQPVEVSAFMDNRGTAVDIDAVISARFRGGALGSMNFIGSASRHDERLAIHGTKGTLVFHLHQWQVREVLLNGEPLELPKRVVEDSPDAAFLRWIRNGAKGYEQAEFAVQVAKFTEAAYRSVERGKPVKVSR